MPKASNTSTPQWFRKRFIFIGLCLISIGVLVGFLLHPLVFSESQKVANPENSISAPQSTSATSSLAVLTAGSLTSTPALHGKQFVTISDVNSTMSWFTDRPERLSGSQPTNELLKAFFESEPNDPPNVTMAMTVNGVLQTRIVTLENPEWAGDVLTFSSTPLEGDPHGVLPENANQVSMTIDSIVTTCNIFLETAPGWSLENVTVTTKTGIYEGSNGPPSWADNSPGVSFTWNGTMPYGCGGEVSADVLYGTESAGKFNLTVGMAYDTGTVWTLNVSPGIQTQSNWPTISGGATPIWWYLIGG